MEAASFASRARKAGSSNFARGSRLRKACDRTGVIVRHSAQGTQAGGCPRHVSNDAGSRFDGKPVGGRDLLQHHGIPRPVAALRPVRRAGQASLRADGRRPALRGRGSARHLPRSSRIQAGRPATRARRKIPPQLDTRARPQGDGERSGLHDLGRSRHPRRLWLDGRGEPDVAREVSEGRIDLREEQCFLRRYA